MAAGVKKGMGALFGALILIVAATAVAPEIFSNTATLEADVNTPGWVSALVVLIAGIGLVYVIYNSVM